MNWKRQGAGLVGPIKLRDGRAGKVVLVGSRENSKGAMLVLATEEPSGARAIPFLDAVSLLHPRNVVEVLCAQERAFGASGLSPIELP
jgi:hypothetical protein